MAGGRTDPGEADIRARLDTLTTAIRAHDIETAMSLYAPDVVSFDLEPPLQHIGVEAKRRNWAAVFAAYGRPLGYEVHRARPCLDSRRCRDGQSAARPDPVRTRIRPHMTMVG